MVTAKSTLNEFEVGKKRVIKKVETFIDLMLTTKGDEAKKETILDLLANKKELLHDKKFGFRMRDTYWFQQNDPVFFLKVIAILKEQVDCQDKVY